jgi:CubicO group peptidase (beta-lactamase class C family)
MYYPCMKTLVLGVLATSMLWIVPAAAQERLAQHGLDAAEYQAAVEANARRGFSLEYVSGYSSGGQVRFAAIWKKAAGPERIARHGLSAEQFQKESGEHERQGFRLLLVNGYEDARQDRFVALWEKSSGSERKVRQGMSGPEYQTEYDARAREGYRLMHVSGYSSGGTARFAAIWEKASGPERVARHGMSSEEYQAEIEARTRAGFHPLLVSGYEDHGASRYAAIWEKSPTVPWAARHGLTGEDYQTTFGDLHFQGYVPTLVNGYSVQGQARFAAIWRNDAFSAETLKLIDDKANALLAQKGLAGLSFAITKDGRLVFAKGYGYANREKHEPVHTSHLFRIASATKPFTATAIMQLVEKGKLKLTDKVFGPGSVLGTTFGKPPYKRWIADLTIQHLLHHTPGGWSQYRNKEGSPDPMFKNGTPDYGERIRWALQEDPLIYPPGSQYWYSNFGYSILGRVIEHFSHKTYENAMRDGLLAECGIRNMHIGHATLRKDEVTYYQGDNSSPTPNVANYDSHGGWIVRPVDMMKFLVRVDGLPGKPDVVSPATLELMLTGSSANKHYGLGWVVSSKRDTWSHNGSIPGTRSVLTRKENGFAWAAVTNSGINVSLNDLLRDITEAVRDWPSHDLFD